MSAPIIPPIPAHLAALLDFFAAHGEAAYPVGGCVRDALLGAVPHDWDVAVTTPPDVTKSLCENAGLRVIPTGEKHGTVTVLLPRSGDFADRAGAYDPIECTTCRTEGGYTDGRHPDAVAFTGRIADDLSRRDFTVNAMALERAADGSLSVLDLFGGRDDLRAGVIRCVGDPATRFSEDALRMLRAVRFAVKLNFALDPATEAAIRALAPTLVRISRERVREELARILCSPTPEWGVTLLQTTGLLPYVLPGGLPTDNPDHGHLSDLPAELTLRLSALLWGQSAAALEQNLCSLRLPTVTRKTVQKLATRRDFPAHPTAPDARRLRRDLGELAVPALLVHSATATKTAEEPADSSAALTALTDLVRASEAAREPVTIADLAIGGNDLMAIGYPAGKEIQTALTALLDEVIDDPARNTEDYLLAAAIRRKNAP